MKGLLFIFSFRILYSIKPLVTREVNFVYITKLNEFILQS